MGFFSRKDKTPSIKDMPLRDKLEAMFNRLIEEHSLNDEKAEWEVDSFFSTTDKRVKIMVQLYPFDNVLQVIIKGGDLEIAQFDRVHVFTSNLNLPLVTFKYKKVRRRENPSRITGYDSVFEDELTATIEGVVAKKLYDVRIKYVPSPLDL